VAAWVDLGTARVVLGRDSDWVVVEDRAAGVVAPEAAVELAGQAGQGPVAPACGSRVYPEGAAAEVARGRAPAALVVEAGPVGGLAVA
jgi:hypothetical protein